MAFDYEIIKHIATLSETRDKSKQVNLISYGNARPKFDIRKWENNEMHRGITLDEDEWAALGECFKNNSENKYNYKNILERVVWIKPVSTHNYKFVFEKFKIEADYDSEIVVDEEQKIINYKVVFKTDKTKAQKYINFLNDANKRFAENKVFANAYIDCKNGVEFIKIEGRMFLAELSIETLAEVGGFFAEYAEVINEIGERKSKQIYFDNVIVIGDLFACVHQEHEKKEMFVLVDFVKKDGSKFSIETKASYCEKCNLFFVRTHDYRMMKINAAGAKMLCQEIEYERYCKNPDFRRLNLNDHSILNIYGYNVNAVEDLTAVQRQAILAGMIDSKIITKERIASYLAFFIRGAQNRKSDMSVAITKWNCDRNFVLDYNVNSRKKAAPEKIAVIKYKPIK